MTWLDGILFGVLPYVALIIFFLITIHRYRAQTFTYSSLSSQLLENQQHFWALVPFHYGILTVLTGHIVAFLIPRQVLLFNARPLRLYLLEITGLIFGLLTLVGLIAIIVRRVTAIRVK
ncbi:MAG: respiratory nitrate reductase subunit gamma, partial [Calditrichaeota bacterium]|nr:respiratory nitrate reductase subunit gamma [Calditrichota bacterium]